MSDSPRIDSLDEFPPESLDLYSSTPAETLEDHASLISIVPASPVRDPDPGSPTPTPAWHRRRRRWFSASLTGARLRRVSGPAQQLPEGAAKQLRTEGARPRQVTDPAHDTSLSLARAHRRERIRRTLTEAAGRDSLASIATVSQLTPIVVRVVATSSSSLVLQLRRAVHLLAAAVRPLVDRAQSISISGARYSRRTWAAAIALVRAIAAALAAVIATAPARFADQRQRAATSARRSVHSVAGIMQGVTPHAVAAVRGAGRILHPRSVAVAAAMLALIVIANPNSGLSDMSAGRAGAPVAPAAVASAPIEPAVRAPQIVAANAPVEDHRPAAPPAIAAATTIGKTTTSPVPAAGGRPTRVDPRAIQTVLNRYRDALSTLDVTAIRSVWPDADVDALRKEFAGVRDQNVEFDGCRISGAGTDARASCAGVIESGFRPGDRRSRVERRRWQFTLEKSATGWKITEVLTQRG
jgi:hypothetical protein